MQTMQWRAALIAAIVTVGAAAQAHELECDKTANGVHTFAIPQFPVDIDYEFIVSNVHPTSTSILLSAVDPFLNALIGFTFSPPPPVAIPVNQSLTDHAQLHIEDFETCVEYAHQDGLEDNFIDNVFTVTFDQGEAQCSARVTCTPPPPQPDAGQGGATRTMGFYKTHEDALSQCLAVGDVDFGDYLFIDSSDPNQALIDALGLLWGSPSKFEDGTSRDQLEQKRFILARQLLTALCNSRLFNTQPTTFTFANAISVLNGFNCTGPGGMGELTDLVDAFNNSGDSVPFPPGFDPGPSTPQDAQAKAVDPTDPQPGSCL